MSVAAVRRRLPAVASRLLSILARLTPTGSPSLLPFIPKPIKLLFLLLIFLNSGSLPFVWHIRVWWHVVRAYYHVYRKGRNKYLDDWSKKNRWDGGVQGVRTRTHRMVTVDDADYNLHLSNSCYAKNSDPARMDWCIAAFSPFFTPGSHMAMAASHYTFLKEIPIGSEYVIETRTGGWGEKWFYVVSEFIMYPKKGGKGKSNQLPSAGAAKSEIKSIENKLLTSVSAAASAPTSVSAIPGDSADVSGASTPPTTADGVKAVANVRAREPRKDGGVVCGLAVFEYCFKIGRVTIPPRIAMYLAMQSPTAEGRAHAKKLVQSKDHGKAWLKGGWRTEPNADTLGRDIGLPTKGAPGEETWFEKGRKGMEKVNEGLGVF